MLAVLVVPIQVHRHVAANEVETRLSSDTQGRQDGDQISLLLRGDNRHLRILTQSRNGPLPHDADNRYGVVANGDSHIGYTAQRGEIAGVPCPSQAIRRAKVRRRS